MRILIALLSLGLFAPSQAQAADESYGVRLLTHFNKPLTESGFGVGGWLIVPNMVANASQPLFIIGPSYKGKGWWAEFMVGYRIDKDADTGATSPAFIQSNRFQLTPKFFKKRIGHPINVWGNLQFIEAKNWIFPYLFLMVDYAVGGKVLVGVETENYFKPDALPDKLGETDISVGPQIVFPFGGLNIITAYQFHIHENQSNQVWVRAMYNFGAPTGPAKPAKPAPDKK